MSHIHWVTRQNKLEIDKYKDEVNKWEIHECDGRANDPDTMVTPLTPKLCLFLLFIMNREISVKFVNVMGEYTI